MDEATLRAQRDAKIKAMNERSSNIIKSTTGRNTAKGRAEATTAAKALKKKPTGHLEHKKDPKHDPGKKSVLTSGTNNWAKWDAEHHK